MTKFINALKLITALLSFAGTIMVLVNYYLTVTKGTSLFSLFKKRIEKESLCTETEIPSFDDNDDIAF